MYAESDEEEARLEECNRRQAEARALVEQEITSLKQRLAKLDASSETETSETEEE